MKTMEMCFACKKCKKVFRKDMKYAFCDLCFSRLFMCSYSHFDESDEYCPNCDNHYVIDAKTPESEGQFMIMVEGDAAMVRDDRVRTQHQGSHHAFLAGQ